MPSNKRELENYVEQFLLLQKKHAQKELSREERLELALSLGFAKSDFEELEEQFSNSLQRARAFLLHENYVDTSYELEQAAKVYPQSPALLILQAELSFRLKKYEEALQIAQPLLASPDYAEDALELMSRVRRQEDILQKRQRESALFGLKVLFFGIGLFLLILAPFLLILFIQR